MQKGLLGTMTGTQKAFEGMSDNLGDLGKGFGKQAGDLAGDLGVGSMLQTGSKAATGMLGMVGISSPGATIRPAPEDEGQVTCGTCGTLWHPAAPCCAS